MPVTVPATETVELHPELDRAAVVLARHRRGRVRGKEAHRKRASRDDRERDAGRGAAALPVGDRIREAGAAAVARVRREGDLGALRVEAHRTVARASDGRDRQGIAVRVGVVAEKRRGGDDERRPHLRRADAVGDGDRRSLRDRLEDDVDPVVGVAAALTGERAVVAVGEDGGVGGRRQRPGGVRSRKVVVRCRVEARVEGGDVGLPGVIAIGVSKNTVCQPE